MGILPWYIEVPIVILLWLAAIVLLCAFVGMLKGGE